MHRNVVAGSTLFSSAPRSAFKLGTPERALLIAGGIGITPLLSMAYQLRREGRPFTLHCCTRSPERTAFREALRGLGASVFVHHDAGDPARGLDVRGLLERYEAGSQVFCCGPRGLMDAVRTASAGWPEGTVHFESFSGEVRAGDQPFEAVIASTGEVVPVGSDQSLLQALREKGLELASDCEAGTCGTCVLGLLEGEAEHRDACLSDAERRTHVALCPCVSRAKGKRIVLDL
jgi:vanillate O-demethylase ferredoxin subunit